MKQAVLIHRIGPYHAARLSVLAKAGPLVAVETCAEDETYAWEQQNAGRYERVTLFTREVEARNVSALRVRLHAALCAAAPDIIAVPGWGDPAALLALDWALQHHTPTVLMSDSRAEDTARNPLAEAVKRRVVSTAGAGFVAGHAHARYLEALGMDPACIVLGYDVVDNAHFAAGADAARRNTAARTRLSLPERYLLAIGRFVDKKNFSALIEAHTRWQAKATDPLPLVLVGDGPMKSTLHRTAGKNVLIRPFATYKETPVLYGLSDGFIFPSLTDQWGLVVNEAMAAGCPVLISAGAGASELIEDGKNGLLCAPTVESLEIGLHRLANINKSAIASKARDTIAPLGLERFANGFIEAANIATRSAKRPSLVSGTVLNVLARSLAA